jgi:hypothetical protein
VKDDRRLYSQMTKVCRHPSKARCLSSAESIRQVEVHK